MFLDRLPPVEKRLARGDTFSFACHRSLSCFNSCCRNKHLPLTPYDILRMKKALKLHSDDFLEKYSLYRVDPNSGFPVLSVNMVGETGVCPFLGPEGCTVYDDRPTACRLFPLGRCSGVNLRGAVLEEVFYLLDAPNCGGVEEQESQTVEEWIDDQGLPPYIRMNDRMLGLLFHPRTNASGDLDCHQQQKVMVACYNIDLFREFVLKTGFGERFRLERETVERVMESDEALLNLGFSYLEQALFPARGSE